MPRERSYPLTTTGRSKSRKIKAARPKTHVSVCESSSWVVSPVTSFIADVFNSASLVRVDSSGHIGLKSEVGMYWSRVKSMVEYNSRSRDVVA